MSTNPAAATYASIMRRPNPAGLAPGQSFDWFDASPVSQAPQGLVQNRTPGTRTEGIVPGTLYGGLVDTRYTHGMEQMMPSTPEQQANGIAGPTANALDVDLASGTAEYDRTHQFDALTSALDELGVGQKRLQGRIDAKGAKGRQAPRATNRLGELNSAHDQLQAALDQFLQTQNPALLPDLSSSWRTAKQVRTKNSDEGVPASNVSYYQPRRMAPFQP